MIRAMQMVILAGLIDIPMPGHSVVFMQGCMKFAQMDIFDAADYYTSWFDFKKTESVNGNYDLFGIDTKNFIFNSGSYFVFMMGFVIVNAILFLLNKLAARFSNHKAFRKLGLKVYSSSYKTDTKYESSKMYLESYFDLTLCAFLGVYSF